MAGSLISYQGFRAQSVSFRRSRGFDSDASWVTFVVTSFPEGFEFVAPPVGQTMAAGDLQIPDLSSIRAATATGKQPLTPSGRLLHAGTLCMAEFQAREWKVVVHPLFVKRIEQIRKSERGHALVRVHLVDEREFWRDRGFLRRWSFNRTRADSTVALDSVKPDGSPYTLADVARQVVAQLPRSPSAVVPDAWTKITGPRDFTRLSPAASALAELVREKHLVDPCLRFDNVVSLHALGDGKVGYALDGKGPNVNELPYDIRPSKGGTAQGHAIDSTYPDDYVIVAGGERIATQRTDEWDPVLVLPKFVRPVGDSAQAGADPKGPVRFEGDGDVVKITDESIRKLTDGRFGLAWLHVFVLDPPAFQNAHGLPRAVVQLFREQAYKRFRMPGVVLDAPNAQGRLTGPNAHVLPLLPRAETIDGRRLPVMVETFRFGTEHRALTGAGGAERDALSTARRQLALLRENAETAFRRSAPFSRLEFRGGFSANDLRKRKASSGDADIPDLTAAEILGGDGSASSDAALRLAAGGVSVSQVQDALNRLRLGAAMQELGVGGYENALTAEAQALDKLNGTSEAQVLKIARKALAAEQALQKQFEGLAGESFRNFLEFVQQDEQAKLVRKAMIEGLGEDLRALERAQEGTRQRAESGIDSPAALLDSQAAVYVRNYDRAPDTGARVYSAELGIVETSTLAGWVDEPGAPAADACEFVPKPVRVSFGATVRPRVDGQQDALALTVVSGQQAALVGADLADEVTWFTAAFKRGESGLPEPIAVGDVPPGDGLVIPKPAWLELVPLEGTGNRGKLDDDALAIAAERMATPQTINAQEITVARPWPVNPDGIVASVEIRSRDRPLPGTGFETVISIGGTSAPQVTLTGQTRLRPPPQRDNRDGAKREGLT